MAKKALFHEVTIKNGHGTHTKIYPAQRGEDLENIIETSDIKVLRIKSVGWHTVSILNSIDEYYFQIDTLNLRITFGDIGFDYLERQFSTIINKINKANENKYY